MLSRLVPACVHLCPIAPPHFDKKPANVKFNIDIFIMHSKIIFMKRTYDDSMFIDTFEHEYTWLNGFMRNVRRFGERTALIDFEFNRTWSYKELNLESNKLANALAGDGVTKNDVVMTALFNCPEFAFSYIGPRKIGAILLAANFKFAAGEFALLIDFNRPKVLIYSAAIADVIEQALTLAKHKVKRVVMADNTGSVELPKGHTFYRAWVDSYSTEEPKIKFRPHIYDEVIRLCTSGTTAMPKCVPINDINEVLSAHDVIMHYPLTPHDITLNMTPWFHRGGCHSGGLCPTFYAGAAAVVMRKFSPQNTLNWVEQLKITFLMGAPASLAMLCRSQEKLNKDLSSLKGLVTMGAPLSKADCEKYMTELCPHIFNGYGTTETFWNSFLRPYNLPEGAGSVGSSCTDDEVRVVKIYEEKKAEPDELVAQDNSAIGEIIIKSPAKSTYSYYNNPEMTQEKFYKGWMYTGDTGTWDKDCIVTFYGRKDDMIVVSGENIYPTQIEDVLKEHPKVKDCLATAVNDKTRGQAVAVYVVTDDKTLTIDELNEFCMNAPMLSSYKRPRYFAIIDKLPMTATGKKKHFAIRERTDEDLASGILKKR